MGECILSRSNPTVSGERVGDVRVTARNTLGNKWVLCNGDYYPDNGENFVLNDPMSNTCWHGVQKQILDIGEIENPVLTSIDYISIYNDRIFALCKVNHSITGNSNALYFLELDKQGNAINYDYPNFYHLSYTDNYDSSVLYFKMISETEFITVEYVNDTNYTYSSHSCNIWVLKLYDISDVGVPKSHFFIGCQCDNGYYGCAYNGDGIIAIFMHSLGTTFVQLCEITDGDRSCIGIGHLNTSSYRFDYNATIYSSFIDKTLVVAVNTTDQLATECLGNGVIVFNVSSWGPEDTGENGPVYTSRIFSSEFSKDNRPGPIYRLKGGWLITNETDPSKAYLYYPGYAYGGVYAEGTFAPMENSTQSNMVIDMDNFPTTELFEMNNEIYAISTDKKSLYKLHDYDALFGDNYDIGWGPGELGSKPCLELVDILEFDVSVGLYNNINAGFLKSNSSVELAKIFAPALPFIETDGLNTFIKVKE